MGKCIKRLYIYDYRKLRDEGNGLYLPKRILSFKITEELGLTSKDQRQQKNQSYQKLCDEGNRLYIAKIKDNRITMQTRNCVNSLDDVVHVLVAVGLILVEISSSRHDILSTISKVSMSAELEIWTWVKVGQAKIRGVIMLWSLWRQSWMPIEVYK